MTNHIDNNEQDTAPRLDSVSAWQDWRLKRFPHLMRRRVEEILLVSSAYDAFSLEEDGLLTEVIYSEYNLLGLTHAPNVTRVSTGEAALAAIRDEHFDLVITMLRLGDMDVFQVDGVYVWHGDTKVFLAIIKSLEDHWNGSHDTRVGSQSSFAIVSSRGSPR